MSKSINILDKDYIQWIKELSSRYRRSQIKAAVKVNAGLSAAGGTVISIEEGNEFWSSTEYSSSSSWFMDWKGKMHCKDVTYNGTKDARRIVRGVRSF